MEKEWEALFSTLVDFTEGFCTGDIERALGVIADDVVGAGLGEQGIYKSKRELRELISVVSRSEAEQAVTEYSAEYQNVDIRIASSAAHIYAEINMHATTNGQTATNSIIQLASARKENGKWLWFAVNALPTRLGEDGIEKYILHFADETLASLKAELAERNRAITAGIEYASKIQSNMLPVKSAMSDAFSDYSAIWQPRDIVGGDIYWMKRFEAGTLLAVADCTGHGTPGAMLTMLVVSALESIVNENNCRDTQGVIWELDQRLAEVFSVDKKQNARGKISEIQDGCDLAVLFFGRDGGVTFSTGNTPVFVCDGKETRRYKGQRIYVGEGKIEFKNDVKTYAIPPNPDNKLYIASDGLFDQIGGSPPRPFGYRRFENIILACHTAPQKTISDAIWKAFEAYRGVQPRRDDMQVISAVPRAH